MVTVIKEARELLDSVQRQALSGVAGALGEPTPALRLVIQRGQPGLALDLPQAADQVVEHEGHSVLLIDPTVSEQLDGMTLGTQETPDGLQLALKRSSGE